MDKPTNNSLNEGLLHVQNQPSSSRFKRKLRSVLLLAILFTLIIVTIVSLLTIFKHKIESKSLSNYPLDAIQTVCWLPNLSENPDSCVNSIASFYYADVNPPPLWLNRDRINPSQILMLSLHASMNELFDLSSSAPETIVLHSNKPKTKSLLKECQGMFKFSLIQLNESLKSLGDDPDEKILATNKLVWDLQSWIGEAQGQVERCIDWLEMTESTVAAEMKRRTRMCQQYMRNSRGILKNVDEIFDIFYPGTGSVFGSLILEFFQYDLYVWFLFLQYLFLFFLFCLILRS
ncbi:PREDICTED: uncharacterized protein LOC109244950 [Nicotiana attenuata]|nr:PREDICTED: uncharacterized protein LOC109244950 [Nicotiana attenuata]